MKKFLSFLLIAVVLVGTFSPTAFAATYGVTSYTDLADAIANAPTDGTVTTIELENNFSATGGVLTIAAGQNIILTSEVGSIFTFTQATSGQRHFNVVGSLTLENVTLSGPGGAVIGGGIQVTGGSLTMEAGSQITNARAVGSGSGSLGGAVYVTNGGSFMMNGGSISQNSATWAGGGVLLDQNSIFTMTDGLISQNTANSSGGGVEVRNSTFTMSGGIISQNTATTAVSVGGGVELKTGVFIMTGGLIDGNRTVYGGGIHADAASTVNISYTSTISNNIATGNGGGIFTTANSYNVTLPAGAYGNLVIASTVTFAGNVAGNGARRPPANALTATQIAAAPSSIFNHPLNNFDINYYASAAMVTSIQVSFDPGSGTFPASSKTVEIIPASDNPRVPSAVPSPTPPNPSDGFIGWSADGGTTVLTSAEILTTTLLDNTIYVAQYVPPITVIFNPNGGTITNMYTGINLSDGTWGFPNVTVGGTFQVAMASTFLNSPGAPYVNFGGWWTAPDPADGVQVLPSSLVWNQPGNITLYAQWLTTPTITLTFDATPYGVPATQYRAYAEPGMEILAYMFIQDPIRTGYTFLGWFDEYDNPVLADSLIPNDPTTYYAQWAPVQVNVTFDALGAAPAMQSGGTVAYNDTFASAFGMIATPIRDGFTFAGWFTQAIGGTEMFATTVMTQSTDITFYAQWTVDTVTVTFDANLGTPAIQTQQVFPGSTYAVAFGNLTTPTRSGHTFSGWFTAATGGVRVSATDQVTQITDHTLYAQWTMWQDSSTPSTSPTPPTPPTPPIPPTNPEPIFREDVPLAEIHYAYIIGIGADRVAPNNFITRAEVANVLLRIVSDETRAVFWTLENPFSDVPDNGGAWFSNGISVANNIEIMAGLPDGTFGPNRPITRAEAVTVMTRFLSPDMQYSGTVDMFPDISTHWARNSINLAAELGWVQGCPDGSFNPNANITRAEFATMVNRILNRTTIDIDTANMKIWEDNANTSAWFYWAMQIASNSAPGVPERNWAALQLPNAKAEDAMI